MLSKTVSRLVTKTSNQKFTSAILNSSVQKRTYANETDGRTSALEEAISSVLIKNQNEFEVTKDLAFLTSTIKTEEDFSQVLRLASRVVRIIISNHSHHHQFITLRQQYNDDKQ